MSKEVGDKGVDNVEKSSFVNPGYPISFKKFSGELAEEFSLL